MRALFYVTCHQYSMPGSAQGWRSARLFLPILLYALRQSFLLMVPLRCAVPSLPASGG